jgi:hypothetical protein
MEFHSLGDLEPAMTNYEEVIASLDEINDNSFAQDHEKVYCHRCRALSLLNRGILLLTRPDRNFPWWRHWFDWVPFLASCCAPRRLSHEDFMKNERKAVCLFKEGAIKYDVPYCKYFYGHALIYGTGGVKKNVPKGMSLLHAAAEAYVGEAFFELGAIYENGLSDSDGVQQDISAAKQFYDAASQVYTYATKDRQGVWSYTTNVRQGGWSPEIFMVRGFLKTSGWHTDERLRSIDAGNRLNWALAGQAFLFGGAAALSSVVQPDHNAALLVLIPVLGLISAVFSFWQLLEAILRNGLERTRMTGMLCAKLRAYKTILDAAYFTENQASTWIAQEIKTEQRLFCFLRFYLGCLLLFTFFVEVCLISIPITFITTWAPLLKHEIQSKESNCSDWWQSTCEGSDVGS